MDKAIGMTPQAPPLVAQQGLHVRVRAQGREGLLGPPPRHALSAFIGRHTCPLHHAPWGIRWTHVGCQGLQRL